MIQRVQDEEEVEEQYLPSPSEGTLNLSHLPSAQHGDVYCLCSAALFKEKPGHIRLLDHHITLCEGAVPRRMSYR